jgi:cutinase
MFSQGTAVMMNAVSTVSANVRSKIKGVVLFGYTKNAQKKGGIPNYPKDRVRVFCAKSDGVCGGTLLVTAGHFAYMGNGMYREFYLQDGR